MASKLSYGWYLRVPGLSSGNTCLYPSNFVPPAITCKMRNRNNFNRKQPTKRVSPEPSPPVQESISSVNINFIDSAAGDPLRTVNGDRNATVDSDSSDGLIVPNSLVNPNDGEAQHSDMHLDDLIGMIRNAERNVILLNQSRLRALEDLQSIVLEKETLQGEVSSLMEKLAETEARVKLFSQDRMQVNYLEEKLQNLIDEQKQREQSTMNVKYEDPNPNELSSIQPLLEEVSSLRLENLSLKNDIEVLKEEQSNVKDSDERILLLESSLRNMETKLASSRSDASELSVMKSEYTNMRKKLETLQFLLDAANEQVNKSALKNSELLQKLGRLEKFLEEAELYKSSSEKYQKHNDLMQNKIKLLENRLHKSDEEIQSYVQLYEESVKDFEATIVSIREESKKRTFDMKDEIMPWEFWSRLLLIVDGWHLENKLLANEANLLKDMVWKRDGRIRDEYMKCIEMKENEMLMHFRNFASSSTSTGLHIIHIAAEMAPVAKVGGLGDVVSGLGKALQKKGHLIEIILPKYDCMDHNKIGNLRALDVAVESYFDGKLYKNIIWVGTVEGLPVYFIEPLHPSKFFLRGEYYGEHDDFKRFSYFSRAALELILHSGKKPDIIHCHDWQTAFVAPLYWDIFAPKGLNSARICFTCHNFEYQGIASASELVSCGLDPHQMNRPDRMRDDSSDRVNAVKGAVVFSNVVTTVSPTYAQEVRTPEGGKGLHETLVLHSKKFIGVLNGIDTDAWNPETDTLVNVQYSAVDFHRKAENKTALRKLLGLSNSDPEQPLVGCITRLVPQKGVHLIRHALYKTLELGGQYVLLGSSPVPHIQREFDEIAKQFEYHPNARLVLKYDESLSRLIYAASDMFIIPSISEPCGLTQMIAMRYGSIPIARKTGGLNDSVFDIDDDTIPVKFRNGFTFLAPDERGLDGAMERAFNYCRKNPDGWNSLVRNDMNIDFNWDSSCSHYEQLYYKCVARARAR